MKSQLCGYIRDNPVWTKSPFYFQVRGEKNFRPSVVEFIDSDRLVPIGDSRQPWANRLFSKSMKGKILNFLHEVKKMISVISVQVCSKN